MAEISSGLGFLDFAMAGVESSVGEFSFLGFLSLTVTGLFSPRSCQPVGGFTVLPPV